MTRVWQKWTLCEACFKVSDCKSDAIFHLSSRPYGSITHSKLYRALD